jgi:bacillithiol biosynthesis deacetylase BshB1
MKADVLFIGAHPDDVELAAGGTIALLVKQGYNVGVVDLTEGEMGTRGSRELRRSEAAAAATTLGLVKRWNLKIPDGDIELSIANKKKLVTVIREAQPRFLFIPHSNERHPDHVRAHHLCRESWFTAGLIKFETRFEHSKQAPHRPDHYFHFMQRVEFEPSFIVDITDTFSTKIDAIKQYSSQFHRPESKDPETVLSRPDFLQFIETRALFFGAKIGVKYGEGYFEPVALGVKNVFDLVVRKG